MPQSEQNSIRRYRPGDESEIVRVLQTAFSGWPQHDLTCPAIDHWRWRYADNCRPSTVVVVFEADNKIAGCVHSTPIEILLGGEAIWASLGGDTALLEDYRGQNLVKPLFELVVKERRSAGIQFSIGETRNPHLLKSLHQTSYPLPLDSRHLVKIRSLTDYLRQQGYRWFRIKALGFRVFSAFKAALRRSPRIDPGAPTKIRVTKSFDRRFDTFWQEASRNHAFIIKRDRGYLNWRYADPRAGNYRILTAESGDGLAGYAVTRISANASGRRTAYLVDLLCLEGKLHVADALIEHALESFREKEINAVHCLVPRDHPYYGLLLARGFDDSMERTTVFLRFTDPMPGLVSILENKNPGSVHYCYGDIDTI